VFSGLFIRTAIPTVVIVNPTPVINVPMTFCHPLFLNTSSINVMPFVISSVFFMAVYLTISELQPWSMLNQPLLKYKEISFS
jgi:hypothetical protein